jgi:hypothetical protein
LIQNALVLNLMPFAHGARSHFPGQQMKRQECRS